MASSMRNALNVFAVSDFMGLVKALSVKALKRQLNRRGADSPPSLPPLHRFNPICRLRARPSTSKFHAPRTFTSLLTGKTMADVANKYAENVAGKFYVDDQCIDCDLCRETAPANFKRNDDGGHSYVYKQPETPEEEALCKEAMEGCPVEAIGDNGA